MGPKLVSALSKFRRSSAPISDGMAAARSRPIARLPGFDPSYYLETNRDVRESGVDPLDHYLCFGWREGRDPSARFSTAGYLRANPDVLASEVNPLVHFVEFGSFEERQGWAKESPSARTSDGATPSTPIEDAEPSTHKGIWSSNLSAEVTFWSDWLEGRCDHFPPARQERQRRFRNDKTLPDWMIRLLPEDQPLVRILDLGSGPISALGDICPGRTVELTALDPLADMYDTLLKGISIVPQTRTIKGEGENLDKMFPENYFDICYSQNALDHSHDPMTCYSNMMKVLKPGGALITLNAENEAITENFWGLHQWNFALENGRFIISSPRVRYDVLSELGSMLDDAKLYRPSWEDIPGMLPYRELRDPNELSPVVDDWLAFKARKAAPKIS